MLGVSYRYMPPLSHHLAARSTTMNLLAFPNRFCSLLLILKKEPKKEPKKERDINAKRKQLGGRKGEAICIITRLNLPCIFAPAFPSRIGSRRLYPCNTFRDPWDSRCIHEGGTGPLCSTRNRPFSCSNLQYLPTPSSRERRSSYSVASPS